jgi:hypothetical protein
MEALLQRQTDMFSAEVVRSKTDARTASLSTARPFMPRQWRHPGREQLQRNPCYPLCQARSPGQANAAAPGVRGIAGVNELLNERISQLFGSPSADSVRANWGARAQHRNRESRPTRMTVFARRRFYRGGFRIRGLRTLPSRPQAPLAMAILSNTVEIDAYS